MLTVRLIPCLDVDAGRVVKGTRFQNMRDMGDPAEMAGRYESAGADEVVLLDISATPLGRSHHLETVRRVREKLLIPLTVGGGVRSWQDAAALLDVGADKVAVNTAAVLRAEILTEISSRFGRQCTVLALDARRNEKDGWDVVIESGKKRTSFDVVEWAKKACALGAGEILLTSFDCDGTRSGYDLELIAAVTTSVEVPVIASGGAASPADLFKALQAGASAVLAASIFHERDIEIADVKNFLAQKGVCIRPC